MVRIRHQQPDLPQEVKNVLNIFMYIVNGKNEKEIGSTKKAEKNHTARTDLITLPAASRFLVLLLSFANVSSN